MATLKPVFPQWGEASTTAGNASGVGDGAALCILASRERAEKEGLPIIAKYVGTAVVGVEPRYMGIAPVYAVPKVLEAYGLKKEDIDVRIGDNGRTVTIEGQVVRRSAPTQAAPTESTDNAATAAPAEGKSQSSLPSM